MAVATVGGGWVVVLVNLDEKVIFVFLKPNYEIRHLCQGMIKSLNCEIWRNQINSIREPNARMDFWSMALTFQFLQIPLESNKQNTPLILSICDVCTETIILQLLLHSRCVALSLVVIVFSWSS